MNKQLNLNYEAHNYTDTSRSAWINTKNKLTKREQVLNLLKNKSYTNYEIAEELKMTLSSVCARCRELQLLNLVQDSGRRRESPYGKQVIVWEIKKEVPF
jgi:predicted transcriptional regulator